MSQHSWQAWDPCGLCGWNFCSPANVAKTLAQCQTCSDFLTPENAKCWLLYWTDWLASGGRRNKVASACLAVLKDMVVTLDALCTRLPYLCAYQCKSCTKANWPALTDWLSCHCIRIRTIAVSLA